MRGYNCDGCGEFHSVPDAPVTVRGVGRRSGILTPAPFQEYVFCSLDCFWKFMAAQTPPERQRQLEETWAKERPALQ